MFKIEVIHSGVVTNLTNGTEQECNDWYQENFKWFPNGHTYQITNITAEKEHEKKLEIRRKKRLFGESMVDTVSVLNESKNGDADSVMIDPTLSLLREHLWAGNIKTFLDKIKVLDLSMYFTEQEKQSVIQKCENFLISIE
jgi:fructosamine-3-kinase